MIIISIDSVRNLPATALFGSQVIELYILGGVLFLIPTAIIASEFTQLYPIEGGIYTWVSKAFGKKLGFLAIWLQWIENVVWFPSIVSFIAAAIAYLVGFKTSVMYYSVVVPLIFWICTVINIYGIQITESYSIFATIFGLILPYLGLLLLPLYWYFNHIPFANPEILSHLGEVDNFSSLDLSAIGMIYLSLAGIEITASHIKDVDNPTRTYPIAIITATIFILISQIFGSMGLMAIIPLEKINLIESVISVFAIAFEQLQLQALMPVVAFLFLVGTIGTVINWIIAPIRSLEVATIDGFLPRSLMSEQSSPPIKLLITQAIIVTILSLLFMIQGDMNQSYWLLSIVPAGLYLFMYLLMFLSYLYLVITKKVSCTSKVKHYFLVVCSTAGLFGTLMGLYAVALPPKVLFSSLNVLTYSFSIILSISIFTLPAIILMVLYKNE